MRRQRTSMVCVAVVAFASITLYPALLLCGAEPDAVQIAVDKGLRALAQSAAIPEAQSRQNVAIAAFDGLAFLASGSDPTQGDFSRQVRDARDTVLANCQPSGLIAGKTNIGPMYGHGYATLFLGELYLQTHDPSLKPKLQKAVELIQSAQNQDGGWRYLPKPLDADVSVTACQLNALAAAKAARIDVNEKVIHSAIDYIRHCQNADGGFRYMAGPGESTSNYPRTAAAIAALVHAGVKISDPDVTRGIAYLLKTFFPPQKPNIDQAHYCYLAYYASQCLPPAGDQSRMAYDRLRDQLLAEQRPGGSWSIDLGEEYTTASALIALQAPQERLWIDQLPK